MPQPPSGLAEAYDSDALGFLGHLPEFPATCDLQNLQHTFSEFALDQLADKAAAGRQSCVDGLQTGLCWHPTPCAPSAFREQLFASLADDFDAAPASEDTLARSRVPLERVISGHYSAQQFNTRLDLDRTSDHSHSRPKQRRQESNRRAQKRWRARRKVGLCVLLL